MGQRTDVFDLGTLGLASGEARRLELNAGPDPLVLGGERYEPVPPVVPMVLDAVRTAGGWALRMRYQGRLSGPCVRCLARADAVVEVDSREVHQSREQDDPELSSPYVDGEVLDVRAWARDALALALPEQILCREDCLGLCAECGENLNDAGEHAHERAPDPRWAGLAELRLE